MKQMFFRGAIVAALAFGLAGSAAAGDLKLSMQNGRVTILADNVPLRQILQEWARVGQARIVNAEKVSGPNVTLQLVNVPEREALDVLLRSASGYIAAPRAVPVPTAALYDRVTIMPFSRPPSVTASATPAPPTFQRPPVAEDDDPPVNVMMPPQPMPQNPIVTPYPGMQAQPAGVPPGVQTMPVQSQPGMPVMTAPRPGALPTPQMPQMPNGIPNPYQPIIRQPGPGGPGGPGTL
jgi:hypothetical protein